MSGKLFIKKKKKEMSSQAMYMGKAGKDIYTQKCVYMWQYFVWVKLHILLVLLSW